MKERRVSLRVSERAASVCALAQQFLIFHAAACLGINLFYGTEQTTFYRYMLLLALPIFYLALVRRFVKLFFLCLIFHLPVFFAIVFVGQDFGQKTIIGFCTIMIAIISLQIRTMEVGSIKESPSIKLVSLLLICYIVALAMGYTVCASYIYWEVSIFIILNLTYESLSNTIRYIKMHREVANFPAGQMVIVNRIMVILLLLMIVMGMFLVPMLHLEVLLLPVLGFLAEFVIWLLSFIHPPEGDTIDRENGIRADILESLKGLKKKRTNGTVWTALEGFLEIAVVIVVAAAVIGGVTYLLYRMYKGYYAGRRENADEKEFLVGEIVRLPKRQFFHRTGEKEDSFNYKIRREYRRYVKKYYKKKETVPAALTPKELLDSIQGGLGKGEQNTDDIRSIYERARYGYAVSTKEELEEIKAYIKNAPRSIHVTDKKEEI